MTRTVLTTGANSGLGLATVLEIARRGFRSVGTVRSKAKATTVRQAARRAGVEVETVQLDLGDAAACADGIAELSPLYGVVNNAGFGVMGAVEDVDDDEARQMIETMVVAPMRLARLALPAMRAEGAGRIINISSIYGRTTTPLTGWYQGCKHALEAVSDALRVEVASSGVKVVLVEPGGFRTAIWDELEDGVAERADSRYASAYRRSLGATKRSLRFMGDPQQVAAVVARALEARQPHARYLVGVDAQVMAALGSVTPTPIKDFVSRQILGL